MYNGFEHFYFEKSLKVVGGCGNKDKLAFHTTK
jgi:hypothetical protein